MTFLETENEQLFAYLKRRATNAVVCVVNLDPAAAQEGVCIVPVSTGVPPAYPVRDLLAEETYTWRVGRNYVKLAPARATSSGSADERLLRASSSPAGGSPMSEQWFERDPLWFKRAVFYEIHIRGFFDGNDDGSGDFRGLIDKLDYLEWLGVDCLWLLPMYESPLRDGGYDIADFFRIHPDYGTVDDFREFVEQAHQRGMRVIADLVMNHTSSDHPWFQESRADPTGPKGDWYVWSDTDEPLRRRADHLRRHRDLELDVRPGARPVLLAPLLPPPARPELRQPRGAGGDARGAALLARPRPRRLPARRRPVPLRARGHDLREPRRDPRLPRARPRRGRRALPRPGAAGRGEPVAGGRRRVLRRRRRGRVPHGLPLPGDAAHVHGRCAARTRRRSTRSSSAPRRSPTTRSGASSCATTTS